MNNINETSRRQKAQQAIQGKNKRVRTIGIVSAQNPMGKQASKEYNQRAQNELISGLKNGRFMYYVTDGLYGSPEKSVMIYNISLNDLLHIAKKYSQESVIYVDIQGKDISYQYYEIDSQNGEYVKRHEENDIVDATNDNDYYTKISRHFKFRIPFFEHIRYITNTLNERAKHIDVDKMLSESLDSSYTGLHKYKCRGELYYKKNVNLNKTDFKNITENVIKRLVNEGYLNDEYDDEDELYGFEEYEKGYPNSDFNPNMITKKTLIDFCKNYGDFLYIINGFRGWGVSAANSDEIKYEIISDLYKCSNVEPTHDKDYLLYNHNDWFDGVYVAVMKVIGVPNQEDYYIIYTQDR